MKKTIVPPIKTQGIKTKLVPWINQHVNFEGVDRYVEVFLGSGVVGFNTALENALFCDSNPHIINFYQGLKDKKFDAPFIKGFLIEEGEKLKQKGGDHYYEIRERFNDKNDPLDFLFLNRSCFNGMIRFNRKFKFNVPWGHKPERFAQAYITKIFNQIRKVEYLIHSNNWEFKCQDFQKTLAETTPQDFVYCDPPYIGRHVDYFDSWNEDDENALSKWAKDFKGKMMLSTWHSNAYRENLYIDTHWNNLHLVTREHFYHIGAKEKNRKPVIEALIANYKITSSKKIDQNLEEEKPEQLRLF